MTISAFAGGLDVVQALLNLRPDQAEIQAEAFLQAHPESIEALLILGAAHRRQGNLFESLAVLKPLVRAQAQNADAHAEWGATQAAIGLHQPAIASLRQSIALNAEHPSAWRELGSVLARIGEPAMADAAFLRHTRAAANDPDLRKAAVAVEKEDFAGAEGVLRLHLAAHPDDVAALRMLGDVRLYLEEYAEADVLFARCLALAPSLQPARLAATKSLLHQGRAEAARPHIDHLLAVSGQDPEVLNLQAVMLAMVGDRARAIAIYRGILSKHPDEPYVWLRLGHASRTAGARADAVSAYRSAAAAAPWLGEAYWSLANLKTGALSASDIATMQAQAGRDDLSTDDRFHFEYALGSAYEQSGDYTASFEHYARGAKLKRSRLQYDSGRVEASLDMIGRLMTPAFFASAGSGGHADPAPIFVVGLPRAGSTLVEQILASHSQVEGTSELLELQHLARDLGWEDSAYPQRYTGRLAQLSIDERTSLGRLYIERTQRHRRHHRAFFIDKMPDNFAQLALIQMILPQAKIIDIRRAPIASCFAAFKQLFARGTSFSYDLSELGRYYRNYADLMKQADAALPGRVHRVLYENLVTDTETEIRRLLSYCGLAFEPACLRFHETARDVLTASSEQVRQPIFREALDHWRNYEPFLGELKAALGPLAEGSETAGTGHQLR